MVTINIAGREYPLRFDANVTAQVQKWYGNVIPALGEQAILHEEQIRLLTLLVNEGISYHNYQSSARDALFTEQQIGMLLSPYDLISWGYQKIIEAFNEPFPKTNTEKKTQNQES